MALLDSMNNITYDEVANEAALDMMIDDDFIAMESDAVIDTIVDGQSPLFDNDDLDDDDMYDEIDEELANESYSAATEGAKFATGAEFLRSLALDNDDPIVTHAGSLGSQSSRATFDTNFSDEFDDDNDPITTHIGSYGQQSSKANFDKNYSDASRNSDPAGQTKAGSIGQKNSTAKDPAMEEFLGGLVTDEDEDFFEETDYAMEGKMFNAIQRRHNQKVMNDINTLGMAPYDQSKVSKLHKEKKYDDIIKYLDGWKSNVMKQAGKGDPNDKKGAKARAKAAKRLTRAANTSIIKYQSEKMMSEEMKKGADAKAARKIVRKKMKDYKNMLKAQNKLTKSVEAALDIVDAWMVAQESAETAPGETHDGAVGSDISRANFAGNYSNGSTDNSDPIQTKDGAEGQEDSSATHDTNYAGNVLDEDDPIVTDDGSVGQKNSTAKDPAHESYIDPLEYLLDSLDEEFNAE